MRHSSPAEVIAWCDKVVLGDMAKHKEYGSDLNPFSTDGARNDWQRGYDGAGPRSYEDVRTIEYDTIYQRGAAMRRLVDSQS